MKNGIPDPALWQWRCYTVEADFDVDEEILPAEYVEISFPEDGVLNLYSIKGISPQNGKKFLLTGEFEAEDHGSFFAGMAGDGKFLIRFNSEIVLDGRNAGNNEFPLQKNSHVLELDHHAGRNQFSFEVPASGTSLHFFFSLMKEMKPLAFRYGPYVSFPDSSENAVSILFTGTRNSPAAVDYRKQGDQDFFRVYDNLGGQRRRDRAVHHIRLADLEENAFYEYRCILQDDCRNLEEIASPDGTFFVPSADEKNFSFIFTADLQNTAARTEYLTSLLGKDHGSKADFFVFGGDLYWTSNFDRCVMDEFMEVYRNITEGKLPLVMVRGNHEIYGKESNRYFEYFTPPGEGREGYYLFRRGEVCFIVLDFCDDDTWMPPSSTRQFHDFEPYLKAEKKWLRKAVMLPVCQEAKYRIVLAHGVPVGDPKEYMPTHVREVIDGIFTGADPLVKLHLWLGGHVHRPFRSIPGTNTCYSVMDPARFNGAPHPQVGVDHDFPVVITGGPNGRVGANMQYTSIHVDVGENGLLVRSLDMAQREFDAFTVASDGSVTDLRRNEEEFQFYTY